jgi:hypothetical protein
MASAVWSIEVDADEMAIQVMALGFYVKFHGHI